MEEKIHVLHVLNSASGGSALSTLELIEVLQERGITCSLICFNNATIDQANRISELVHGRVLFIPLYWTHKRIRASWWKRPLIEIFNQWETWGGYRYQKTISRLIREHKVSLVHTSTILNREGAIAARRNGLPHLWHVRELIGPDKQFRFQNYVRWASYVSANCEFLVANSSVSRQCLTAYFPLERIKTIPNGIKVQEFSLRLHTNSAGVRVVAMVGSVTSRWKNHEFFIRTAALLSDRQDIEFRIYGTLPYGGDSYYRHLQELVSKYHLTRIFKFESFTTPAKIIREIDVMFHPTTFESFGRIFVEAMAGGIPVVAMNDGGAIEMIVDGVNGYLIPPKDAELAAAKIRELVDSPSLRNEMGALGRDLALRRYSLSRLSDDVVSLYKEVLGRNTP